MASWCWYYRLGIWRWSSLIAAIIPSQLRLAGWNQLKKNLSINDWGLLGRGISFPLSLCFVYGQPKAFTDTVWESQWPCDDSEEIKRPKTGFQLTIQRQIQVLNRGKKFLSLWYHWQFYDPLFSSSKRSAWQPCYPTSSWHCYLKRRRRIPNIFALAGFAYTFFGSEHAVWNLGRVWRLDYG